MDNTKIEWAHHTFNMWWGCVKVSPGCKNCYAEAFSNRLGKKDIWGPSHALKVASAAYRKKPYRWDKLAALAGEKHRVFAHSMSDVFEDHPDLPPLREKLFRIVEDTPNLIWMLLTKRPDNIAEMIPAAWHKSFPQNVWLGTSIESSAYSWRLDCIADIPAPVHFVSFEPLLSSVTDIATEYFKMRAALVYFKAVERRNWWWIIGGESGLGAREMKLEWAEELLALAAELTNTSGMSITPFVKQLGKEWAKQNGASHPKGGDMSEWPESLRVREVPE